MKVQGGVSPFWVQYADAFGPMMSVSTMQESDESVPAPKYRMHGRWLGYHEGTAGTDGSHDRGLSAGAIQCVISLLTTKAAHAVRTPVDLSKRPAVSMVPALKA